MSKNPPYSTHLTVTRLRLYWTHPGTLLTFLRLSWQNVAVAQRTPGLLGGSAWIDPHLTFWTVTLWQDAASMRTFARGNEHLRAMNHLQVKGRAYAEAAFASGPSPTSQLPTPAAAATFLSSQPNFAELPYPSDDHRAKRFPSPKPLFLRTLEPNTPEASYARL